METPTQDPTEPRTSQTFQTGEGKAALGVAVASAAGFALERLDLVSIDATGQHIILAGVFLCAAALIVSRGWAKSGTGF